MRENRDVCPLRLDVSWSETFKCFPRVCPLPVPCKSFKRFDKGVVRERVLEALRQGIADKKKFYNFVVSDLGPGKSHASGKDGKPRGKSKSSRGGSRRRF